MSFRNTNIFYPNCVFNDIFNINWTTIQHSLVRKSSKGSCYIILRHYLLGVVVGNLICAPDSYIRYGKPQASLSGIEL